MPIGRPLSLTPNIASKTLSVTATASQTSFTVQGGYRVNELGVYRNGVRLSQGKDFTASDGSTVTLLSGATVDDIIDFQIFDSFNIADAINTVGDQTLSGQLTVTQGYVIGITSSGTLINAGDNAGETVGVTSINFVGSGNTFAYDSDTNTVDVSISGSGSGGGASKVYNDTIFAYQNIVQSDVTIASPYLTATMYISEDVTVDIEDDVTVTVNDGASLNIITI